MKITLAAFSGAIKALHAKLLPDSVGVDSRNQKPQRGDLRPWKQPLVVATVPAGRQTIYRFGRDVASDANYWFTWNAVVHAVRGYNSEDTTERTYFTGSGAPKWTDNTIALASAPYPTAYRDLGVPVPTVQPITSASGGSAANTESVYVTYTFVTDIGEESAPATPALELVRKTDDTITVNNIGAPPGGAFTINRVRVYATVSGQSGDNQFYFQKELAAGTASTTLGPTLLTDDVLVTTGWLPPPADLSNLTEMWNGMLAGISGMGVRVCEAYKPYAWKVENEHLPPDAKPVSLGVWQQNLLILTTAKPAIVTGTSPDSLDLAPLEYAEACIAPRATVSFGHGVAWVCPDGLAYYGNGGAKLLTAGIFTRDDWQAMNPAGMVASIYEGWYVCFYTDAGAVRRGFMLDPLNPTSVFFLDTGYSAVFFDRLQDALYVYDAPSGQVGKWDAGAASMTAVFRSKAFVTPPVNFGWSRVVADNYPVTLKVDAGPFTLAQANALAARNPAYFSAVFLANMNGVDQYSLRFTKTVTDELPFRLPDGFDARNWQVQIDTAYAVQPPVILTTDPEELV